MKKTILLSAAALMVVAACSKQEASQPESKVISLKASVEQQVDPNATKTALDGTSVVWAADDAIKVFDEAGKAVKLTADAAGTSAHFSQVGDTPSGFNEVGALYAIYPYADGTTASGSTITFNMPATQTYVADSFDPACNVMVGVVETGNISFKNTCGILKLSLKGVMTVGKIELTTKGSEKLWGTFWANAVSDYTATYSTGGSTMLTLDCDDEGGVMLDAVTAKDFYFVVPSGAFANGFDAVVYDIDGYVNANLQLTLSTVKANTISRRTIKAMPVMGLSLVPTENYVPKHYIESDSTPELQAQQYINTSFIPKGTSRAIADFQYMNFTGGVAKILGSRDGVSKQFVLTAGGSIPQFQGAYYNNPVQSSRDSFINADTNRHLLDFNKGVTTVDGLISTSYSQADFTIDYPVYLFAANYEGTSSSTIKDDVHNRYGGSYGRMYSVRLYDDGTLSHFFIPVAKVLGGEVGMYDRITGVFFGNSSGIGVFTAAETVLTVDIHK